MIDGDIMSAPIIDGAVKGGRFALTLESSASAPFATRVPLDARLAVVVVRADEMREVRSMQ